MRPPFSQVIYTIILCLCMHFLGHAQYSDYNRFSIDLQYGASIPFSPDPGPGNYMQFKHVKTGVRYAFNPDVGARFFYSYNYFQDSGDEFSSIAHNQIGVDIVVNLSKAFVPKTAYDLSRNFRMMGHAGIGVSTARSQILLVTEYIGNLNVGLGPQFRINDNLSFFADGNFTFNFRQHLNYNSEKVRADGEFASGLVANLSFGLIFYLGQEDHHADWH